jgi:hypothetical protein
VPVTVALQVTQRSESGPGNLKTSLDLVPLWSYLPPGLPITWIIDSDSYANQ